MPSVVLRHPETLQSLRPARTAGHEYLHLVVKHSQLSLPLSRNEGLAELYSNIDEFGGKIRIGNPIPAHLYQLRTGWLPLKNVLKNVLAGAPVRQALEQTYGMTVDQVEDHLRAYVRGDSVCMALLNLNFDKSKIKVEGTPASPRGFQMALAGLSVAKRDCAAAEFLLAAWKGTPVPDVYQAALRLSPRTHPRKGVRPILPRFEEGQLHQVRRSGPLFPPLYPGHLVVQALPGGPERRRTVRPHRQDSRSAAAPPGASR